MDSTLAQDRELVESHEADHVAARVPGVRPARSRRERLAGYASIRTRWPTTSIESTRPLRSASSMAGQQPWSPFGCGKKIQQNPDLAQTVADAVDTWIRDEWPLNTHIFRRF